MIAAAVRSTATVVAIDRATTRRSAITRRGLWCGLFDPLDSPLLRLVRVAKGEVMRTALFAPAVSSGLRTSRRGGHSLVHH